MDAPIYVRLGRDRKVSALSCLAKLEGEKDYLPRDFRVMDAMF